MACAFFASLPRGLGGLWSSFNWTSGDLSLWGAGSHSHCPPSGSFPPRVPVPLLGSGGGPSGGGQSAVQGAGSRCPGTRQEFRGDGLQWVGQFKGRDLASPRPAQNMGLKLGPETVFVPSEAFCLSGCEVGIWKGEWGDAVVMLAGDREGLLAGSPSPVLGEHASRP